MYDVLDRHYKGGKLVIRCMEDKKEQGLINTFLREMGKNRSAGHCSLMKMAASFFTVPQVPTVKNFLTDTRIEYVPFSENPAVSLLKVPAPPPKVCC
jgi:hypothetical protein